MNFRDISKSVAGFVCVLFVFNAMVYKARGRHLNISYTLIKYKNLLRTSKEISVIASETIKDFKSKSLFGYKAQGSIVCCNITYNNLNMTEKEKLIENEKKISAFLKPLTKVMTDMKGKANATHSLKDLTLLRFKIIDLILTIKYVESHLHYDVPHSNNTKTCQPPYHKTSNSLGNRIVNTLSCFQTELFNSMRFFHDRVKELKLTITQ